MALLTQKLGIDIDICLASTFKNFYKLNMFEIDSFKALALIMTELIFDAIQLTGICMIGTMVLYSFTHSVKQKFCFTPDKYLHASVNSQSTFY